MAVQQGQRDIATERQPDDMSSPAGSALLDDLRDLSGGVRQGYPGFTVTPAVTG